jgi:hypothetical protein
MGIRLKKYNNKTFPIPSGKLFEIMLKIKEPLTGQSVKVLSPIREEETPSFIVYYSNKGLDDYYRFKCFSSGHSGDAIDLFTLLYGKKYNILDRQDAYYKILEIINSNNNLEDVIKNTSDRVVIKEEKELTSYGVSKMWSKFRADYWRNHGCQKNFIEEYRIKPLDFYEMTISKGNIKNSYRFDHDLCFGYFTKSGELYKIYNPGKKIGKFVKVKDHIQGIEQLKKGKKYCLILSSMKDAGAFLELGYDNFNVIIPDSENVDLPKGLLQKLQIEHRYVFTLFDNDIAGMKRMIHYKKEYNIPYIHFNVEKDLAQCRFDHGKENTKEFFKIAFSKALAVRKKELKNLPF